ncbi:MAG: M48 family metallopeptidase [Nevskiaceae bacterium]
MHRLVPCLALLAGTCLAPAAAQDATPPADEAKPLAAKVELVVPAAAQAGPDFDVERATQAWVETLTPEQRARSKAYFEGGYWLQLSQFAYGLAIAWVFLGLRLSARLRDFATRISGNATVQSILYGLLYVPVVTALGFPMTWYAGLWREQHYGLATQTFGPWFGEQMIGLVVGMLLGAALIAALYAVFRRTGRSWWLWGSGVGMAFLVVTIFIAPMWIDPLFNDYKALPHGPLRDRILSVAHASGVPADEVYWFDASRQTKRISANVAGFGSTTRIALNDNLLNRSSSESIEAVMGHELGHYVLNHIYELLVYFAAIIVVGFAAVAWAFNRVVERRGAQWGVTGIADPAGVPLLAVLFSIYFFVLTPVMNSIIRSNEVEADRFGIATSGQADGFAMVSMQLAEYRKIDPGYWEEIIFYDHPSGENRVRSAMQWKKEHMAEAAAP